MSPPVTFHELIRFCREQVVQILKAVEKHRATVKPVEGQWRSEARLRCEAVQLVELLEDDSELGEHG